MTHTTQFAALGLFFLAACGGNANGDLDGRGDGAGNGKGNAGSSFGGSPVEIGTGGSSGHVAVGGSAGSHDGYGGSCGGPAYEPCEDGVCESDLFAIIQPVDSDYLPPSEPGGTGGTGSGTGGTAGSSGWGATGGTGYGGTGSGSGGSAGTGHGGGGSAGTGGSGGYASGGKDAPQVRLVWGNAPRECGLRWHGGCGNANATVVVDRADLVPGNVIALDELDGFMSASGPNEGSDDCWGGGGTVFGDLEILSVGEDAGGYFQVTFQVEGSSGMSPNVDGVFQALWCD